MDVCNCTYICLCMPGLCRVILIILTSQCPVLGEREVRKGGGWGWENGKERYSATTLHMNNRDRSVIPPGVGCIGRPAAQAAFQSENNWEYQLSLQEDYVPWVEYCLFHHIPSSSLFILSSCFFIFLQCILLSCCTYMSGTYGSSTFSPWLLKQGSGWWGHEGFLMWLIFDAKSEFALYCDLLS